MPNQKMSILKKINKTFSKLVLKTTKIHYLLIVVLTIIVFSRMMNYGLIGGDFGYFHLLDEPFAGIFGGPIDDVPSYKNLSGPYLPHAILGRVLHFVIYGAFGDNLRAYRFLELAIIILTNVCFYKMLKDLTKDSRLSFLSTMFFTLNYPGMELYSQYAYFIERGPIIPIVFISFAYWVKSIELNDRSKYFTAIFLFCIALFLGHYTILFLPMFISYALVKCFKSSNIKRLIRDISLKMTPVLLIVLVVGFLSVVGPFTFRSQGRRDANINPVQLLLKQDGLIQNLEIQLTSLMVPSNIITMQAREEGRQFIVVFLRVIAPASGAFILLSIIALAISGRELRVLLLTFIFSLLGSLLMNLYVDRVDFSAEMGASRLYFIPYIFYSVCGGIIIYSLLKRHVLIRVAALVITTFVFYSNYSLIQQGLSYHEFAHKGILMVRDWARLETKKLAKGSVVFLPPELGVNPLYFFNKRYGNEATFLFPSEDALIKDKLNNAPRVIQLEFNDAYKKEDISSIDVQAVQLK